MLLWRLASEGWSISNFTLRIWLARKLRDVLLMLESAVPGRRVRSKVERYAQNVGGQLIASGAPPPPTRLPGQPKPHNANVDRRSR